MAIKISLSIKPLNVQALSWPLRSQPIGAQIYHKRTPELQSLTKAAPLEPRVSALRNLWRFKISCRKEVRGRKHRSTPLKTCNVLSATPLAKSKKQITCLRKWTEAPSKAYCITSTTTTTWSPWSWETHAWRNSSREESRRTPSATTWPRTTASMTPDVGWLWLTKQKRCATGRRLCWRDRQAASPRAAK